MKKKYYTINRNRNSVVFDIGNNKRFKDLADWFKTDEQFYLNDIKLIMVKKGIEEGYKYFYNTIENTGTINEVLQYICFHNWNHYGRQVWLSKMFRFIFNTPLDLTTVKKVKLVKGELPKQREVIKKQKKFSRVYTIENKVIGVKPYRMGNKFIIRAYDIESKKFVEMPQEVKDFLSERGKK